ncbi:unnamed protein product [Colias eurytheme]|nr:unnamed protein product [Colias eurytheme]
MIIQNQSLTTPNKQKSPLTRITCLAIVPELPLRSINCCLKAFKAARCRLQRAGPQPRRGLYLVLPKHHPMPDSTANGPIDLQRSNGWEPQTALVDLIVQFIISSGSIIV